MRRVTARDEIEPGWFHEQSTPAVMLEAEAAARAARRALGWGWRSVCWLVPLVAALVVMLVGVGVAVAAAAFGVARLLVPFAVVHITRSVNEVTR
jgi:hypothetical protein